jgi:hypothetical protein
VPHLAALECPEIHAELRRCEMTELQAMLDAKDIAYDKSGKIA